jgi:phytoene dehydrogenase-like protein
MADVIVIGAGLNGLVAATWLARQKHKVIVVDQADTPGGAAVTTEIAPGFHVPALSHALGPLSTRVVRALRLHRHDIDLLTPDPALTTLGVNGTAISFHRDPVLAAGSINRISPADAGRWADFLSTMQRLGAVIGQLNHQAPPSIDATTRQEAWRLFSVARRARRLGRRDLARAARYVPMAVADLAAEWFEQDLVQAAVAAHAVFGNLAGPWSAGTSGMLLQRVGADPIPVGSGITARGGPGAVAKAFAAAAEKSGADIRLGARVARIGVTNGRATSVVLESGSEIGAGAVLSAIDPRHTFLRLCDPADLPPAFLERMRHYRARGVTAKLNLALSAAPAFSALHGDSVPLRGRLLIAPDVDYIEHAFDAAKYGGLSPHPWLELSMPSTIDASLAPAGSHVMSIYVHYAPRHLRQGVWSDRRDLLYDSVIDLLEGYAPGIRASVIARDVITPEDLEQRWGLDGGHIFHGEPTMDQSWIARPLLGWSQYRTPIEGLFIGSAGTHPGGGLTGISGLLAAQTLARHLR